MYYLDIKEGGHIWEKQNLVTITKGRKSYDEVTCSGCQIKGKRTGLETVEILAKYKQDSVRNCKGAKLMVAKKVKITNCHAGSPQFKNLVPDSIHEIVAPPKEYEDKKSWVWVMGVGEPVRILDEEYELVL